MRETIRRLAAFFTAAALLFSMTVFSAAAEENGGLFNFTRSKTYMEGQYTDVPAGSAFAANVKAGYEYGIMQGYGTSFGVAGNITRMASIIIAGRLHAIYYHGENDVEELYRGSVQEMYLQYAKDNGIYCSFRDVTAVATRAEFAVILSSALP